MVKCCKLYSLICDPDGKNVDFQVLPWGVPDGTE